MIRISMIACLSIAFCSAALAQPTAPPADLARLPEAIKTLPWKTIDLAAVTPVERARALLIMNHVLDEVVAWRTSEADLMSQFIQDQNLGAAIKNSPPPPAVADLSYTDAMKVAVALLRGPLAKSAYASELSETTGDGLNAYVQMYERTCQRRFSELSEARQKVRYMTFFLVNAKKGPDYQAWATAEAARREQQYKQKMAANRAAAASTEQQRQAAAQQVRQQQLAAENQALRQALASTQQPQDDSSLPPQQAQQYVFPGNTDGSADINSAPPYYGNNVGWATDTAYVGVARANTEQRMNAWNLAASPGIGR